MGESASAAYRSATFLDYLRLFRLPNVFTAIADVVMGYLFTSVDAPVRWVPLLVFVLASSLLYTAGMVLNDVFDMEQDRRERPERPLPSGRISMGQARWMGWGMLLAGTALAVGADAYWGWGRSSWGAVSAVAVALALCIVLYDALLKPTLLGPWTMGSCRVANVLLGMTGGAMAIPTANRWWPVDEAGLMVAVGLGVYVAGVTWFARSEATDSRRPMLVWGVAVMLLGLTLLGIFPEFGEFALGLRSTQFRHPAVWPLLLALIAFSIVRRAITAIWVPSPQLVQVTVKQCILSILVLDAAVCLAARSPVWWAIGIIALMIPMLVLGRWVYST